MWALPRQSGKGVTGREVSTEGSTLVWSMRSSVCRCCTGCVGGERVWHGGPGLQRMERRLAGPISQAKELRFYPAGGKHPCQACSEQNHVPLRLQEGGGSPGPGVPK